MRSVSGQRRASGNVFNTFGALGLLQSRSMARAMARGLRACRVLESSGLFYGWRGRLLGLVLGGALLGLPAWCGAEEAADAADTADALWPENNEGGDAQGDVGQRRRVVLQIEQQGPDRAVPLLLRALRDGDGVVRARAAEVLGHVHAAAATGALLERFGDGEPMVRARAAEALGQIVPIRGWIDVPRELLDRVVPGLVRALGDTDHRVRRAAVLALGRSGDPAAVTAARSALVGRLEDESAAVRRAAVEALASLGGAAADDTGRGPGPRPAVALLGRLDDASREVRIATLVALGELGDPRVGPAVIRMLGDAAQEVRVAALAAIARLRLRGAVPALLARLEHPTELQIERVLLTLGALAAAGDPVAPRALVAELGRRGREVGAREALLAAGSAAVPALLDALATERGDRAELLAMLAMVLRRGPGGALVEEDGLSGAREASLASAEDSSEDPFVQADGSDGVRKSQADRLSPEIAARAAALLRSELERGEVPPAPVPAPVPALVIEGLAALGDRRAVPLLLSRLAAPTVLVMLRRCAAAALVGLADGRAAQVLLAASQDPDREVRLQVVTALGAFNPVEMSGTPEVVPRLGALLGDADAELAQAAARALGHARDVRAQPALLRALGATDRRVRRAAGDALVALAGRGDAAGSVQAVLAWLVSAPPYARADGLVALGGLLRHRPEARARTLLLSEAGGSDPALAESALTALGLARDPATVDPLVRMLDATAPERRRLVAQTIGAIGGAIGGAAARQALGQALGHATPAVRAEAAWALGKAGASEFLPALTALLGDKEAAVRTNAVAALDRLGVSVPALLLDDRDPFVRANAALAAPEAVIPGVVWLARHDPEPVVRGAALRRLGRGTLPVGMLRGAEQDPAPLVRALAHDLGGSRAATTASRTPGAGSEGGQGSSEGGSDPARDLRLYLTDEAGKTLANRAVRLLLSDGRTKATMSDAHGLVFETAAPTGGIRIWLAPASHEGQASR